MRIAIDGTAASGKGTLAKQLASTLGYTYVDTGALYRAIAYLAFRRNVSWADESGLKKIAQDADLRFVTKEQEFLLFCGDENLTQAIRQDHISKGASEVSVHIGVREALFFLQQQMAKNDNVIMDGRDIASVIMPDADLKIFIDADIRIRANRRFEQIRLKNPDTTYDSILIDLEKRDQLDRSREHAPLVCVPDAHVLDTSHDTIEESLGQLLKWCSREK